MISLLVAAPHPKDSLRLEGDRKELCRPITAPSSSCQRTNRESDLSVWALGPALAGWPARSEAITRGSKGRKRAGRTSEAAGTRAGATPALPNRLCCVCHNENSALSSLMRKARLPCEGLPHALKALDLEICFRNKQL